MPKGTHPNSLAALRPPQKGERGALNRGGKKTGADRIRRDTVESVLADIVRVDVGDLFRRADGTWRRALLTADLAELPKHVTRAIQSIRIRRPGRTQWITKYRADGMVKERRELPPAEAQGDNEVEVTFYSKTDAAEKIAKFRGWYPKEDTTAGLDALVSRLQQARQITVTQVTASLPDASPSVLDVTPVDAPNSAPEQPHAPRPTPPDDTGLPLLDTPPEADEPGG